jgi:hypothetical protein
MGIEGAISPLANRRVCQYYRASETVGRAEQEALVTSVGGCDVFARQMAGL